MTTDLIAEATKDNFHELVAHGQVLVDVWGPDCRPCLALLPHVEQMAETHRDQVRFVKLEAPTARRLCMSLKVMSLPAFLFFRDGEEVARIGGAQVSAERLSQWLEENKTTEVTKGAPA